MVWTQPFPAQGSTQPEPLANRREATADTGVVTGAVLTEILAMTPDAGSGLVRLTKVEVAVDGDDHFIEVQVDGESVAFGIATQKSTFVDWFPVGDATSFTPDGAKKISILANTLAGGAGTAWAVILAQ